MKRNEQFNKKVKEGERESKETKNKEERGDYYYGVTPAGSTQRWYIEEEIQENTET